VSEIQWTDVTWNPVRGCSRVSEGCRNCYAERIASRFSGHGKPFDGFAFSVPTHGWTGRVELVPEKLDEPLHWKKPRRVFVNSMSDLFHEKLEDWAITRIFDRMGEATQHTFQVLTKRPGRMLEYMKGFGPSVALHNVWLGVSVEDQKTADERIPLLLQTPAAVRFVSYEPALGPVSFRWMSAWPENAPQAALKPYKDGPTNHLDGLRRLDWLIVGGESGPGARPFDLAWARSTIAQCKAAGVPVFVKQLGGRPVSLNFGASRDPDVPGLYPTMDRKGGDPSEWPEDLRVREFPA
jgi:protein gp37